MLVGPFRDFARVGPYLRPYRGRLTAAFGVGMLASLSGLAQPYLSQRLIDGGLLARRWDVMLETSAAMFAIALAGFALNLYSSYRYVGLSARMLFDMRRALFEHLLTLSPRFYARTRLGDILSRLNGDLGEVQRVASDLPLAVFQNLIFLVGSVVLMLWISPRLFIASLLALPAAVWLMRQYQRRVESRTHRLREESAGIGSFLVESLSGVRQIASSNAQLAESSRFAARQQSFFAALMDLQWNALGWGSLPATLFTASTAGVFLYGGWLVLENELTTGGLIAFLAYYGRLLGPVQGLMGIANQLVTARVSLDRVFELFEAKPEVVSGAREFSNGDIEFEDVCVSHEGRPVLDHFTARIPAGKVCAIVGESGIGKSTIADLLVRLIDPDSGAVRIGGVDLREMRLEDLRRGVALAEQTPFLWNASVRDNLGGDDVEAIARELGIAELLDRNAGAGERGTALSAGERQRIGVARVLLRNSASIYVLDEPTSALDEASEAAVMSLIRERLQGRTLIVITHRARVAAMADQVIDLSERRVGAV